jgi:hypothetical protein
MSIFGSIMSKIFGHPAAAQPAPAGSPSVTPDVSASASTGSAAPNMAAPNAPAPGAAPAAPVDVEAVLTEMASHRKEKLDWRRSIVDLMKLLDLDSSLTDRKELAKELNYSGNTEDSAAMNLWLHKEVMEKLAANGGKVPDDLKAA